VSKKNKIFWLGLSAALSGSLWLWSQDTVYYESDFDGAWAGFIRIATAQGRRDFPLVLNMNSQAEEGSGFALMPDDLSLSPTEFEVFSLLNFKRAGRKVTASLDDSQDFVLRYKKAKDFLKGTYKSSIPEPLNGTVFLYRQSPDRAVQKVWEGSLNISGVKTPVFLQCIQKTALGESEAAGVSVVTGVGFVGEQYGKITGGSFDGTRFSGNLGLGQETVVLDLNLKTPKMNGTFGGFTFSGSTTLLPAGTLSKAVAFKKLTPRAMTLGESNLINIKGKNLGEGIMFHTDNPAVEISAVQRTNKRKASLVLFPPDSIPTETSLALRVTNPDGTTVDFDSAFALKMKEVPFTVSFSQDIQPVFNSSCALSGCHAGNSPSAGLNLGSGVAYGNIVNRTSSQNTSLSLIKPGDPANSYLIRKIKGEDISGSRMPLGRAALSMEIIARFENWVREGAVNN